jgi:cytochrome c-type biogenesis protein CcmH
LKTATPIRRALPAALALLAAFAVLASFAGPATAATVKPRASFTQIESDLMCIDCHEPLAVAQSPEAFSERAYIRELIGQGLGRQQIEKQMVQQYGSAILAKPPAHGFNLLVYILPPALLVAGLTTLGFALPRWRRRTRQAAREHPEALPALDPDEARRLDADLARNP